MDIKETYIWHVMTSDDQWICEHSSESPHERVWSEIDISRMTYLQLLSTKDMLPLMGVRVPEGAEPVFFRRRSLTLGLGDGSQSKETTHCIGWKRGDQGVYLFVSDDGTALLSDDLQAV